MSSKQQDVHQLLRMAFQAAEMAMLEEESKRIMARVPPLRRPEADIYNVAHRDAGDKGPGVSNIYSFGILMQLNMDIIVFSSRPSPHKFLSAD